MAAYGKRNFTDRFPATNSTRGWSRHDQIRTFDDIRFERLLSEADGARKAVCNLTGGFQLAWAAQQARIDELMLEYYPVDMTAEQIATWACCQRQAP